jgi:hypothetical protein
MRKLAHHLSHLFLPLALAACDQFQDPDLAQIRSIEPDSAAIGSLIVIRADNLLDNTRVIFAGDVRSPIAALFVDRVVTVVPPGAVSGSIVLETGGERSSSRADFTVVPPPPSTPAFFESETGTAVQDFIAGCPAAPASDDGYAEFTLPFAFPFYGRAQTQMFVSTNGLITFGEPRPCDNNGNTSDFVNADKIAVAGFDLAPNSGGEILVNVSDPEKVVVTWHELALCGLPGTSNTFQAVLSPDGRIRTNYGYFSSRGISTQCTTNLVSGSIVGIVPQGASDITQVTYTVQPSVTIGPQQGVYNLFLVDRFFDLENRSLVFTPLDQGGVFGGYSIELQTP